jgi:flagellar biosynthesis protein
MSAPPKQQVAVALEYDFKGAPRVTAKGRGEAAKTILELAREHGVSIEENPVLAEALSQVELDQEIPEALYRAVAEVLTFVLRARGLLGRRSG